MPEEAEKLCVQCRERPCYQNRALCLECLRISIAEKPPPSPNAVHLRLLRATGKRYT